MPFRELSATQAVAAAGKNVDMRPYVIINHKLGLVPPDNTPVTQASLGQLYAIMKWDRSAVERECLLATQRGRADPLTASRNLMTASILETHSLNPAQKELLQSDVHNLHCRNFGMEMELSTFQCFYECTMGSQFFPQHDRLIFQNRYARLRDNTARKKHLKVKCDIKSLQLRLHGLMDMRDGDKLFEVKERMWPETAMLDKFRWAAHAQITVSLGSTCSDRYPFRHDKSCDELRCI